MLGCDRVNTGRAGKGRVLQHFRSQFDVPLDASAAQPTPEGVPAERLDGRNRIIATLGQLGAVSRAELARRTALAPSTVSTIVADLVSAGLVVEVDGSTVPASGRRGGRPATLVALHRVAGVAIGVDLGKRHVRVALADLAHNLLAERREPVASDRPAREDIDTAVALVEEVLTEAGAERSDVIGVGMGLPGPVRETTGLLGDSTILPGWVGVNARQAMSEALQLPVAVDNDANLGALGEWTWGAARGYSDVAYLKVSTGIGAGLIIGGRPYHGVGGTAGEVGHIAVESSGPICRCGNRGCLEMLAGADAILESLRVTHGAAITIRRVIELAREGDPGCRRVLADAGHMIGTGVGVLCNLTNPQRIVVGGEIGSAGDLLLPALRESLERVAVRSAADDVDVVEGELGERAEVLGALALAFRHGSHVTR